MVRVFILFFVIFDVHYNTRKQYNGILVRFYRYIKLKTEIVLTRQTMRRAFLFLFILLSTFQMYGQTSIQTKEIKIQYSNGYEVFKICNSGCTTTFDDNKEYFWYTEFSNIKSTKGGSGGSLLHGNYKFYDENGNMRQDKNYFLGLPDGNEKNWDSVGNITSQSKYSKGILVYSKFQSDEKYWIELNGPLFKEGTVRKVYTQYNSLIQEDKMLTDFKQHVKIFYENSGKIKAEYNTGGLRRDYKMGKYISYYENGKIEVEGQYCDEEYINIREGTWKYFKSDGTIEEFINNRVGTWKWYKSDGTIDATEEYKAEIEKWDNGEMKYVGGYIWDSESNNWVRTGEWRWYTYEGKLDTKKKYIWGVETNE